jgi:hypothetical protein
MTSPYMGLVCVIQRDGSFVYLSPDHAEQFAKQLMLAASEARDETFAHFNPEVKVDDKMVPQ